MTECPICLTNMTNMTTECNHKFCQNCVDKWVNGGNDTCPLCRRSVFEQKEVRFERVIRGEYMRIQTNGNFRSMTPVVESDIYSFTFTIPMPSSVRSHVVERWNPVPRF